MSSLFMDQMPPIIVLDSPGRPVYGSHRYRCLVCTELFPISDTSYQTVRDLRNSRRLHLVLCYGCHRDLVPALPTNGNVSTDRDTARQILGLR